MRSRLARYVRVVLVLLVVLLAGAGAWLAYQLGHPSLAPYRALAPPPSPLAAGRLRATWMGTSTLLLDDGETAILTDGYFSRPGVWRMRFGKVEPDRAIIARELERAGIRRLAAVFAVHSHVDHVMDSPEVAQRTGALLVGTESTANVGRGWGLAEDRLRVVHGGEKMSFGRFEVTVLRSQHAPHGLAMGEITRPLRPPVSAFDYREGGSLALLVEHDGRTVLIQGSAGFEPGQLAGRQVDVAFLAIGGLGKQSAAFRAAYWRELVTGSHARRVVLIHWDDFMEPLAEPLVPMPRLFDDFDVTMRWLVERQRLDGVSVYLPAAGEAIDPFAGLPVVTP